MTVETMAILTFFDGRRHEAPRSQVLVTRWELGLLGFALRWPLNVDDLDAPGGRFLSEAAHRSTSALAGMTRRYQAEYADDDWPAASIDVLDEPDVADSSYWLDAAQVRRIFDNLADATTRDAIISHAARTQVPPNRPDRLIVCLQMLAQATERETGVHFAYYLC